MCQQSCGQVSSRSVVVEASTAYLADWTAGLAIIDVADPTAPALIASMDTPGRARDVAYRGGTIYIADYEAGLRIVVW